jgi:hypothetical protein
LFSGHLIFGGELTATKIHEKIQWTGQLFRAPIGALRFLSPGGFFAAFCGHEIRSFDHDGILISCSANPEATANPGATATSP